MDVAGAGAGAGGKARGGDTGDWISATVLSTALRPLRTMYIIRLTCACVVVDWL